MFILAGAYSEVMTGDVSAPVALIPAGIKATVAIWLAKHEHMKDEQVGARSEARNWRR